MLAGGSACFEFVQTETIAVCEVSVVARNVLTKWDHSLFDGAVTVPPPKSICRVHADRSGYTRRRGHGVHGCKIDRCANNNRKMRHVTTDGSKAV